MLEGLVPYEVITLEKDDFAYINAWDRSKTFETPKVALLPIENGQVVRTATGWAQLIDGKMIVEFGRNEVVWKERE